MNSSLLVVGLTHYGAKPLVSCNLDVNNLMHILNMHKSLKSLIQLTKLTPKLEVGGWGSKLALGDWVDVVSFLTNSLLNFFLVSTHNDSKTFHEI